MTSNDLLRQEQLEVIKHLYENLLEISIQQKALLEQGTEESWDMDILLDLMNQRQKIIRQIDEQPAGDCQTYDQQMVEPIIQIIQRIQAMDKSCQGRLETARQKISSKLAQTRENKKAQLAYDQGDVYNSAWFFDKKQ